MLRPDYNEMFTTEVCRHQPVIWNTYTRSEHNDCQGYHASERRVQNAYQTGLSGAGLVSGTHRCADLDSAAAHRFAFITCWRVTAVHPFRLGAAALSALAFQQAVSASAIGIGKAGEDAGPAAAALTGAAAALKGEQVRT